MRCREICAKMIVMDTTIKMINRFSTVCYTFVEVFSSQSGTLGYRQRESGGVAIFPP